MGPEGVAKKENPVPRMRCQPTIKLKRARPEEIFVISSDSSSDGEVKEIFTSPPKKLCVSVSCAGSNGAANALNRMAIPVSEDILLLEPADKSCFPAWMRDTTDDEGESTDSDSSLVPVNLHSNPTSLKKDQLSDSHSQVEANSPPPPPPSPTPSVAFKPRLPSSPSEQFQNLTVEDSCSPSVSEEPFPLLSLTKPYLNDLQLNLMARGLVGIAGKNKVSCALGMSCNTLSLSLPLSPLSLSLSLSLSLPFSLSQMDRVLFFSAQQKDTVEQLLMVELFPLHQRLLNTAEYLRQIMVCQAAPPASVLIQLWKTAMELKV